MKKLAVFALVLFILCEVSVAVAGHNISGIWREDSPANSDVANAQLMYAQSGNNVQVVGYFEFKGTPCVWYGSGILRGNALEYSVIYSKPYPDWRGNGADGKHVMTLSGDGKTVTGKWHNNNGDSGPARYIKQK
jgi:hypothetical protein